MKYICIYNIYVDIQTIYIITASQPRVSHLPTQLPPNKAPQTGCDHRRPVIWFTFN